MNDKRILTLTDEMYRSLKDVPHIHCKYVIPSYNALLQAAKEIHPQDPFIGALPLISLEEGEKFEASHLRLLCNQLRITLESMMGEAAAHKEALASEIPGY